jgi:hypothetical protein
VPSAASLPADFPETDEGKREITIFFRKESGQVLTGFRINALIAFLPGVHWLINRQ